MDDVVLIERVRQGDRTAFTPLVDRYQQVAIRAAMAALGSPIEADDVAQEAFLVAYRQLGTFRGESSFKTWLLTIVWRRALNRRRGLGQRLRTLLEPDDCRWSAAAEPGPSAEDRLIRAQLRRDVRRAIGGLPVKLRDALLISALDDCTVEEGAAMLGVPAGTIKSRAARARQVLKRRLTRLGYGDA